MTKRFLWFEENIFLAEMGILSTKHDSILKISKGVIYSFFKR